MWYTFYIFTASSAKILFLARVGFRMKGVSGIVATAIMLALTIVGGVLMYTYVTRYLDNFTNSAEVVVTNAYYIRTLGRLTINMKNVGMSPATVDEVEIILSNDTSTRYAVSISIPPGGERTVTINLFAEELPLYIVIKFSNGSRLTDPYPVRVVG